MNGPPEVQIVGVTTTHSAAMIESIKAGHVVSAGEAASLADALPGPIPVNNQYTFELCKTLVDDIVQSEEECSVCLKKDIGCYAGLRMAKLRR